MDKSKTKTVDTTLDTTDREYSIQLLDESNTYRSKVITGTTEYLLNMIATKCDHLDRKKVTVLVVLDDGQWSTLPLYSLSTFVNFLELKKIT